MPFDPQDFPVIPGSDRREGLLIKLSRIRGVTKRGYLKTPYHFQCPPLDEIPINYGHERSSYRAKKGEFSRGAGRNLRTVEFQTLAVHWAPWILQSEEEIHDLDSYQGRLRRLAEGEIVFRLQAAHLFSSHADSWLIDWPATLMTFTTTERAGENDARYFNCSFQEWRDPWVEREDDPSTSGRRYGFKDFPRTHTLDANDTLHSLAKFYYGITEGWRWIAAANGLKKWGPNQPLVKHSRFKKGSKIKIPRPKYLLEMKIKKVPDRHTGGDRIVG